jgi:hypothetical protein
MKITIVYDDNTEKSFTGTQAECIEWVKWNIMSSALRYPKEFKLTDVSQTGENYAPSSGKDS